MHNRDGKNPWVPRTGFSAPTHKGSLGEAGHRMLGHHVNRNQGQYSAVPAPQNSYNQPRGKFSNLFYFNIQC